MLLEGKRLLITGVLTRHSIAFRIAERALAEGADVLLTTFGRTRRMTERSARRLGIDGDPLEFDALEEDAAARLREELSGRVNRLDGAVHAIGYAPEGALGGEFMATPPAKAEQAFRASAHSLAALAAATTPLMTEGGAIVALDFDASQTWPVYNWMGVAKAALESVGRYLARDLGPRGVRVNLVSAGPLQTAAASAFESFQPLAEHWQRTAPLGWDSRDATTVADTACALLSDFTRGVTGSLVHVDGGMHLLGAGIPADATAPAADALETAS